MKQSLQTLMVCLAIFCAFCASLSRAAESEEVITNNATSVLLSEKLSISPGETITLGFHQKLRKGWHVYWQNPGDSGLPLSLEWGLPAGLEAGEIIYPLPHRLPLGELVNYGHEGRPTFLIELTAAEDVMPGSIAELELDATWLICSDICVPERGTFLLQLPISAESGESNSSASLIFKLARNNLPAEKIIEGIFADVEGTPVLYFPNDQLEGEGEVHFFPYQTDIIKPGGEEKLIPQEVGTLITFTAGYNYTPEEISSFDGVLTLGKGRQLQGVKVAAAAGNLPESVLTAGVLSPQQTDQINFLWMLSLAFLGGLILNIMPCVFPVVFLKVAHLTKSAHQEASLTKMQAVAYTFGIVLSFLILAGLLMALRAGGEELGWGFHLQSPLMVSLFALVILAVSLNLAGVFEIGTSLQNLGQGLTQKRGLAGSFFTGLLTVAVAAPCIGPLLGAPIGAAFLIPTYQGLFVFISLGLGLAFPYLVISFVPVLAKLLPRPGAWMITFKQFLAFPMLATLIWLIWTLTLQAGTEGLILLLSSLLLVGFSAWLFGRSQLKGGSKGTILMAVISLLGAILVITDIKPLERPYGTQQKQGTNANSSGLPSVPYSEAALAEYRSQEQAVFIDFTAAWCVTCQLNKRRTLRDKTVIQAFEETNTVYMIADWTLQDAEITKALEAQGRNGVPLYLYYAPKAGTPKILPQILSSKLIINTLNP